MAEAPLHPDARRLETPPEVSLENQLRTCIHCGLCLSSCPTYLVTGDEAESPRGRLVVMADLLPVPAARGSGAPLDRAPLDRCLGCRNCETVCPSGVPYGGLLEESRGALGPERSGMGPLLTWMMDHVLTRPRRLYLASRGGAWLARGALRHVLPRGIRQLLASLPARRPSWPRPIPAGEPGNVALLAGCAQRVFTPEVLPAAMRLVRAAGGHPFVPAGQGCCGALSHHAGSTGASVDMARSLVRALAGAREVVVPSAGCSAHMRGYGDLLRDDPELAEAARRLAERTSDLVEWLNRRADRLSFSADPRRIVYHPPCHHVHAQRLVEAPFRLLRRVPELEVVRIPEEDRCCGSAGSYSLLHPDLARRIRSAKLDHVLAADPDLLVTANPGCELYLQQGLSARGRAVPVVHLGPFLADRLRAPENPRGGRAAAGEIQ